MQLRGLNSDKSWDYENGYFWFSGPERLNKLLAHYELYKSIQNLPGHIFELGVYKAASLIRFATFRNALENDFSRKIVGFDSYGKFPVDNVNLNADLQFIDRFEGAGGDGLAEEEVESILRLKKFQNVELVKGNVFDTLGRYLELHPATKIALLHLDMDVNEPTAYALEMLYSRVVPGGLIVIDDYNSVAGATEAVDRFIKDHNLKIEKLNFYNVPAFIRKP